MQTENELTNTHRIGFHYFPDTRHYTNQDLEKWLPELKKLQASWLVLQGEAARAIPEVFITGLVAAGIEPVLHLPLSLPDSPSVADLKAMLHAYASWGVKYIILFDRPNSHDAWTNPGWAQANLVESFLDHFLPLANECLSAGLNVVFPPLEPGGNYWDISFLHNSLLSMQRRNQKNLLNHLHLSAYARTYGHPLDWGKGGFERWSGNKPYATPADSQDQIGFNNGEWLQEIAKVALGHSLPLFLLGLGQKDGDPANPLTPDEYEAVIQGSDAVLTDPEVIAATYWLFSAEENDPAYASTWIKADGTTAAFAPKLKKAETHKGNSIKQTPSEKQEAPVAPSAAFPIKHYLLLPAYEWGVSDWHLDVIKPFVRKHQPTIGFSLAEAALAEEVTVIGGEQSFSEESLSELRSKGCRVERISGDGTSIATQLSER
jgi:hypothetical protein